MPERDDTILDGRVVLDMDNTAVEIPPPHLAEAWFRLYEPHITRAVDRWPDETEFSPEVFRGLRGTPVGSTTFAARFRDAIASGLRYRWKSTVDYAKLETMDRAYVQGDLVTQSVWMRAKIDPRRPTRFITQRSAYSPAAQDRRPATETAPVWRDWDESEVIAACLLQSKKREGLEVLILFEGEVRKELCDQMMEQFPGIGAMYDKDLGKTMVFR